MSQDIAKNDVLRIAVLGACGRMGRLIVAKIAESQSMTCVARIDRRADDAAAGLAPYFADLSDAPEFDLLIDFSVPQASMAASVEMRKRKKAWLLATTGLNAEALGMVREAAIDCPLMIASNTSIGVALMQRLCAQAAASLTHWDCEIVESHHRMKVDAPSGTAMSLAEAIAGVHSPKLEIQTDRAAHREARKDGIIGMSSLRGGTVAGEHSAIWFGPQERFEITHIAEDRSIFASGALSIAPWLAQQSRGLYSMQDFLAATMTAN